MYIVNQSENTYLCLSIHIKSYWKLQQDFTIPSSESVFWIFWKLLSCCLRESGRGSFEEWATSQQAWWLYLGQDVCTQLQSHLLPLMPNPSGV